MQLAIATSLFLAAVYWTAVVAHPPHAVLHKPNEDALTNYGQDTALATVNPLDTAKTETGLVYYWGQGDRKERNLAYYCQQYGVSAVVLAFVADYTGGANKSPVLDLSGHCESADNCPTVARDIQTCQRLGIKVLVSMGGAVGPYLRQKWDPDLLAWWMWNKFLSGQDRKLRRPFGDVILDGVDLDPEQTSTAGYDRFIDTLRQLAATSYPRREMLISAAPQCPDLDNYRNNAQYSILYPSKRYNAYPDMVFVQFYNNECSATSFHSPSPAAFNFDRWDQWARQETGGRSRVYLGIMGMEDHADTGYVDYERLTSILDEVFHRPSFGGVMMWDASYAYQNPVPMLGNIQYGEAVGRYLSQLHVSIQPLLNSLPGDDHPTDLPAVQRNHVPLLIPIMNAHETQPLPCSGISFALNQSITCGELAQSFGRDAEAMDIHLRDKFGVGKDALLMPDSRICLEIESASQSIIVRYVYNASHPLSPAGHLYVL